MPPLVILTRAWVEVNRDVDAYLFGAVVNHIVELKVMRSVSDKADKESGYRGKRARMGAVWHVETGPFGQDSRLLLGYREQTRQPSFGGYSLLTHLVSFPSDTYCSLLFLYIRAMSM